MILGKSLGKEEKSKLQFCRIFRDSFGDKLTTKLASKRHARILVIIRIAS